MKIFQLEIGKQYWDEFYAEIIKFIRDFQPESERGRSIFTPNPEICLRTLDDPDFLSVLRSSDYLTSDGLGLFLAYQIEDMKARLFAASHARYEERRLGIEVFLTLLLPYFFMRILFDKSSLYKKYGDRICGSDLTDRLVNFASDSGIRIAIVDPYFPDDAGKCAAQESFVQDLTQKFPQLAFDYYIVGKDSQEEIFRKIQDSQVKIVFCTLGMKRQEIFVREMLSACPGVALGLGVGSAFDYYTGFQKRAPKIWADLGFEWLYRIFTSPNKRKRLGRIKDALIIFPFRVLFYNTNASEENI